MAVMGGGSGEEMWRWRNVGLGDLPWLRCRVVLCCMRGMSVKRGVLPTEERSKRGNKYTESVRRALPRSPRIHYLPLCIRDMPGGRRHTRRMRGIQRVESRRWRAQHEAVHPGRPLRNGKCPSQYRIGSARRLDTNVYMLSPSNDMPYNTKSFHTSTPPL